MTDQGEMEARRVAACRQLADGVKQAAVAHEFHVSRTTASRWARAVKYGADLRARKRSGRPCRLTAEQILTLHSIWETKLRWTMSAFAKAIEQTTGVKYDPDHVGRLTVKLGMRKARATRTAPLFEEAAIA